jgi:iron complex outermembrane receptor protein
VLYDYAGDLPEAVEQEFTNTDIAFSPSVVAAAGLTYRPLPEIEIAWLSKYVARQFMDNTSNRSRSLDPYFINDLRFAWTIKPSFAKELTLSLLANNFLGEAYESNGYTWAYLYGGEEYRENYYFPQAGRNYQLMAALRF